MNHFQGILLSSLCLLFIFLPGSSFAQTKQDEDLAVETVEEDEIGYRVTIAEPFIELHTGPAQGYPKFYVIDRGTEVRIIDREGNTLPDGEAGELCVRGPQVMQGYWQRPEATAEVLSDDGWLRTGDIAIRQQDGYLKLVDRLKDIILVSGFNVYPNEIEEVASSYPDILECAAISVPDSQSGEAIKLFVVPATNRFDADRLRDYLRTQLTPYKVPKHIALIDELPKSNVGKILRRELRD